MIQGPTKEKTSKERELTKSPSISDNGRQEQVRNKKQCNQSQGRDKVWKKVKESQLTRQKEGEGIGSKK